MLARKAISARDMMPEVFPPPSIVTEEDSKKELKEIKDSLGIK